MRFNFEHLVKMVSARFLRYKVSNSFAVLELVSILWVICWGHVNILLLIIFLPTNFSIHWWFLRETTITVVFCNWWFSRSSLKIYLFIYFGCAGSYWWHSGSSVFVAVESIVGPCRIFSCGMIDLVPWPGTESGPPALRGAVLVTGLPGKSLFSLLNVLIGIIL